MASNLIALFSNLGLALIGGIIPILVWLWFWEHEDKHPEPHKLTFLAFIAGMAAVIGVIPFEDLATNLGLSDHGVIWVWAIIEEVAKFAAVLLIILWRTENDEPIDSVMYMIVAALGFAALENALYILSPILNDQHAIVLTTLNLRFLGATLLHVACSSIIGFALALSFYKKKITKWIYAFVGLCIAIVLHTRFNLSIMSDISNSGIFTIYALWIGFIVILLLFEKIKQIKKS